MSDFAPANERRVIVVEFVRNVPWSCGRNKFYLAHQAAAPLAIDMRPEFRAHRFQLSLPGLAVGRDLQATRSASHGAGVSSDRHADDSRPDSCEPRNGSFRVLKLAQHATQEISCFVHEPRTLAQRCE